MNPTRDRLRLILLTVLALATTASGAFVTRAEWRDRGKGCGVDWTPAEIAQGKGKPAFAYKAMFGRRIATELIGAGRCPVTELPNGRDFELGQGVRLRVQQLAEYELPGGGKVAPPFGLTRRVVVLPRPPPTNSWRFRVTLPEGARLLYQPELTQAEKDAGCVRPAHVVGSYAVRTAGGLKLGHIYRPVAVDANGAWTWGTLAWDAQTSTLTKTVPAAWLAAAAYPVETDENFGYEDAGLSSSNHGDDFVLVCGPWTGAAGSATAVYGYLNSRSGTAGLVTLGFYDDDAGDPNALEADTDGSCTQETSADWHSDDLDEPCTVTAQSYYIGANCSENCTLYFDAGTADLFYDGDTYVDGVLPNPHDTTADATERDYSFYVEYTPEAEGVPLPVLLHHYRQQGTH